MNWQISQLDRYAMVSNSDAHSPQKLGREATRFNTDLNYDALFNALQSKQGFEGTLEYFPEEGKYHLDGHRQCHLRLHPKATKAYKGTCPVCKKRLTVGVLHRIEDLADRPSPQQPPGAPAFDYLVPLPEIIAQIVNQHVNTKRVWHAFAQIIQLFGNEFTFLQETPIADIAKHLPSPYAIAIDRLRRQEVKKEAGYDGVYGKIHLWEPPVITQPTLL